MIEMTVTSFVDGKPLRPGPPRTQRGDAGDGERRALA